jgi:archaemetzincin
MRSLLVICLLFLNACQPAAETANSTNTPTLVDQTANQLAIRKERLVRFFKPMKVEDGDWLQEFPEDGQTFEQYIASSPTLPTDERKTIYIQPMGKFTGAQLDVIKLTADYMRAFYNLPVKLMDVRPIKDVPPENIRIQFPDNKQIKTTYFVDNVLPKLIPDDAAAFICFTNYDLYPGDTWNYVFGQASLDKRVGVWSLWRLEREDGKKAEPALFLERTLKIAMHETGHMFSMRHCTKYECLMSGTNHLGETDRRPLDTCPECTAKIAWAMKYPLDKRYENLAGYWGKLHWDEEHQLALKKLEATKE